MEKSQSPAKLFALLGVADAAAGYTVPDHTHQAPCRTVLCRKPVPGVPFIERKNSKMISPRCLFLYFPVQVIKDHAHVAHDCMRIRKNRRVKPLENPAFTGMKSHQERIIDIACPQGSNGGNIIFRKEKKCCQDFRFQSCYREISGRSDRPLLFSTGYFSALTPILFSAASSRSISSLSASRTR